jgi:hypothetical protein
MHNVCKQSMRGINKKQHWECPSCKKKFDGHQGRVHDTNSPMIKRSISSPTRSRSLKPFVLSTYPSLTTWSNLSLSSLGNYGASVALPRDGTERKCRDVYQSHNPNSDGHGQGSNVDPQKHQMSQWKANSGYTRECPELLFFSPNCRRTRSRIKHGSVETANGRKVAF